MLHVVEGDAGNLHDAFIELGNFFGLDSADTDLYDFLQALNVTQVGRNAHNSVLFKLVL